MSRKCAFIKPNGAQCSTFAIKDSEFCVFHSDPEFLKAKVYTKEWELKKRIRLLNRRLNKAVQIPNELAKSRITIDLIDKIGELEDKLAALDAAAAAPSDPPAETTTDKLKSWAKSKLQQ